MCLNNGSKATPDMAQQAMGQGAVPPALQQLADSQKKAKGAAKGINERTAPKGK